LTWIKRASAQHADAIDRTVPPMLIAIANEVIQ